MKYKKYNVQIALEVPEKHQIESVYGIKGEIIYAINQQFPHWQLDVTVNTTKSIGQKP